MPRTASPGAPAGATSPAAAARSLDAPVTAVWGVGVERAQLLERLRLRTVRDLLFHAPRRYEDRRRFRAIRDLELGQPFTVFGRVVAAGVKRFRNGRSVFELVLDDGTARLHCRWWNLPFMERFFAVGDECMAYGRPNSLRPRAMDHPETEKAEPGEDTAVHLNRVVPIYPLTEGLQQRALRTILWRAVEEFAPLVTDPHPELQVETLHTRAAGDRDRRQPGLLLEPLPNRVEAIRRLHFPNEPEDAERARQRLALDEFIELQLVIQRRRLKLEREAQSPACSGDNRLMKPFLAGLAFKLTGAQVRVLRELRADLAGPVPMRRLLQGDVGSGKTVVAALAALMTLESGWNVAVMAPTEILAEQLHRTFAKWLGPLGIGVSLRTGGGRGREDAGTPELGQNGAQVWIGTHALLEDRVALNRLGLVIIDEQHKFGVTQRETLLRKGRSSGLYPHLLVMTATPIPRTLGLTLYGDLDVSVLDELPAGRGRIRTHVRDAEALPKVWEFVRGQLEQGRQAYVVYPRIVAADRDPAVEVKDAKEIKAVTREYEAIRKLLAPHPVGLLHGQLPAPQKEDTMQAFRLGKVKVLVATSVIEVGVDVPNASLMIIENAEQFGLAQLHQLRGRIGRGAHESHCILVSGEVTPEAQERLGIMAATQDGFALAEADLKLRGPGELVGRQQSGLPDLRFGNLIRDRNLVEAARDRVRAHLRGQPVTA